MTSSDFSKEKLIQFILLISVVSFFAEMTYEGARSIAGVYLGLLGANAIIVGFVAGLGEFLGFSFRFLSGYIVNHTKYYFGVTMIGYVMNLLAVPMLALANHWEMASILIIIERAGRGIRNPSRDYMLSCTTKKIGLWGMGLHEVLDQTGSILGPLSAAIILYTKGYYPYCFAFLLIPALVALGTLFYCRYIHPIPYELAAHHEFKSTHALSENKTFWFFLAGSACIALGYTDFALMAYHIGFTHILSHPWIPFSYTLALCLNIFMTPVIAYFFNRFGFTVLIVLSIMVSFSPPLVFLGNDWVTIAGILLWGVGLAVQSFLMRALIGQLVLKENRGVAQGYFNPLFGLFWFAGSAIMGILYEYSLLYLVLFSVITQLLAVPFFWHTKRFAIIK